MGNPRHIDIRRERPARPNKGPTLHNIFFHRDLLHVAVTVDGCRYCHLMMSITLFLISSPSNRSSTRWPTTRRHVVCYERHNFVVAEDIRWCHVFAATFLEFRRALEKINTRHVGHQCSSTWMIKYDDFKFFIAVTGNQTMPRGPLIYLHVCTTGDKMFSSCYSFVTSLYHDVFVLTWFEWLIQRSRNMENSILVFIAKQTQLIHRFRIRSQPSSPAKAI